ncbi:uncharacterized protein SCHCODRAFT_01124747 [Schizophyllum commune H4-8]|uniref:uncharacterized protein n=1 Tax=Schizophyllum commune (strain H4-8 / FGSC 9210) TaxID=578458 RepID=UPI00215E10A1|nr:uncharacterized protein SCHCODRAFT_01124747 [Schizophyllum commune H4-8]KAI5897156.1 hypothetical protein SCHCODRAFT_01124747 [Schizophyllum commune H4-8]
MLYRRMSYVVKQGSAHSDAFLSTVGILAGDSASPGLWNLYFSDLDIPPRAGDVFLDGICVSHVEQADDVALFSMAWRDLQMHVDTFSAWCKFNFVVISTTKTKCMVFGGPADADYVINVDGVPLDIVTSYKYVGVTIRSDHRNVFATHYVIKASKGTSVGRAAFSVESIVGTLPVRDGKTIYLARVDPHLTAGCEVVLDMDPDALKLLVNSQTSFIRRLFGVGSQSILAPLHTETGILPIAFRRLLLALGYLRYLLSLPPTHLAGAAMRDSMALASASRPGWFNDLRIIVGRLCPALTHVWERLRYLDGVATLINGVESTAGDRLRQDLRTDHRLVLLQGQGALGGSGPLPKTHRSYLDVHIPAHRKALTRLMLSEHPLAIEQLRRVSRYRPRFDRDLRICRLCRSAVEDEVHVLLHCDGDDDLVQLRGELLAGLQCSMPRLEQTYDKEFIQSVVARPPAAIASFARFVHRAFLRVTATPLLLPNNADV